MLRTLDAATGEDSTFIEYDPTWKFNVTDPTGAGLQHYEYYNNTADPYQLQNLYPQLDAQTKTRLHSALSEYWNCGGDDSTPSNCP